MAGPDGLEYAVFTHRMPSGARQPEGEKWLTPLLLVYEDGRVVIKEDRWSYWLEDDRYVLYRTSPEFQVRLRAFLRRQRPEEGPFYFSVPNVMVLSLGRRQYTYAQGDLEGSTPRRLVDQIERMLEETGEEGAAIAGPGADMGAIWMLYRAMTPGLGAAVPMRAPNARFSARTGP